MDVNKDLTAFIKSLRRKEKEVERKEKLESEATERRTREEARKATEEAERKKHEWLAQPEVERRRAQEGDATLESQLSIKQGASRSATDQQISRLVSQAEERPNNYEAALAPPILSGNPTDPPTWAHMATMVSWFTTKLEILDRRLDEQRQENRRYAIERDREKRDPWSGAASMMPDYESKSQDFALWCDMFESNADTEGWDDDMRMQVLIIKLRGPAERMLKKRKVKGWDWRQLLEACKRRILPNKSITQILRELYQVEMRTDDDPETLMCRIENVTDQGCSSISELEKSRMQAETFLRCLNRHYQLWSYVFNNTTNHKDPEELLHMAKQYFH